jgi:hypothetical protein
MPTQSRGYGTPAHTGLLEGVNNKLDKLLGKAVTDAAKNATESVSDMLARVKRAS